MNDEDFSGFERRGEDYFFMGKQVTKEEWEARYAERQQTIEDAEQAQADEADSEWGPPK